MKKIICVVLCVIALVGIVFLFVNAFKVPEPTHYKKCVVERGDSLWTIARQSDMWGKIDASYIIEDMKERSNCTSDINPGQIVYIPMYN